MEPYTRLVYKDPKSFDMVQGQRNCFALISLFEDYYLFVMIDNYYFFCTNLVGTVKISISAKLAEFSAIFCYFLLFPRTFAAPTQHVHL